MKNKIFSFVMITAIVASLASCFKDESLVVVGVTFDGCVENMIVGTEYPAMSVEIQTGINEATQYHWFKKPERIDVKTDVRWESEDITVATVGQDGKVTPVGTGFTCINVILVENDMILEQCCIEVTE